MNALLPGARAAATSSRHLPAPQPPSTQLPTASHSAGPSPGRRLPLGRKNRLATVVGALLPASLLLASLLLGASACAEYAPAEQDLARSYDAASDVLTVTFDTRGIHAQSPRVLEPFTKGPSEADRIERAVAALRRARRPRGRSCAARPHRRTGSQAAQASAAQRYAR